MEALERDVILLLADISGYTRYMLANRTAALHSQGIVTELLEAVIRQAEVPLEVAKLEGDAVFMVAERADAVDWAAVGISLGARLDAFVAAFDARLQALMETLACPCAACRNLDTLRLKVVGHAGRAVRHRVGRFEEFTGVDVILVHRLLKNAVGADSYILLSEAAFATLAPAPEGAFVRLQQTDPDLGSIPLRVRVLAPPAGRPPATGLRARLGTLLREARWRMRARR